MSSNLSALTAAFLRGSTDVSRDAPLAGDWPAASLLRVTRILTVDSSAAVAFDRFVPHRRGDGTGDRDVMTAVVEATRVLVAAAVADDPNDTATDELTLLTDTESDMSIICIMSIVGWLDQAWSERVAVVSVDECYSSVCCECCDECD